MQKNGYFDPTGEKTGQDLLVRPKPAHSMPAVARVMAGEYSQPSTFSSDKKPPREPWPDDIIPDKKHKTQSTNFFKRHITNARCSSLPLASQPASKQAPSLLNVR